MDGDTLHARVDLGFDTRMDMTLRLAGLNAPELPTAEGEAAKARLAELLGAGPVILRTIKDRREKYGRFLARLEVAGIDVNQALIDEGYAVVYNP